MSVDVQFRRAGGGSPMAYVMQVRTAATVTASDLLTIGLAWRTEIVERTLAGRDVNEMAFAAYSTTPFYYTPTSQARGVSAKSQKSAVTRLFNKVSKGNPHAVGTGAPRLSRTGRSIYFPGGYAQFKTWLGRLNPDLLGPRAPHMLQSICVRVGGAEIAPGSNEVPDLSDPANMMRMSIEGEFAARATAHNFGTSRMPQREFFGVSAKMETTAKELLDALLSARLNAVS